MIDAKAFLLLGVVGRHTFIAPGLIRVKDGVGPTMRHMDHESHPPMLNGAGILRVRRLGRCSSDLDRAVQRTFGLVSLMAPGMTFRDWRSMVGHYRLRAAKVAGLMVIEDGRGYAHGLFAYAIDRTPSLSAPSSMAARPVLWLRDIVLAHVPGLPVEQTLAHAAEEQARAQSCRTIRLDFLGEVPQPRCEATLGTMGFSRRAGSMLLKSTGTSGVPSALAPPGSLHLEQRP